MIPADRYHRSAFTLVELLVTVAIISLLASLLLPTLSRAKSAADLAVCRNNLRQQGMALASYVAEAAAFPPFRVSLSPDVTLPPWRFWPQYLESHLSDKWPDTFRLISLPRSPGRGVFACPSYNKVGGLYRGFDLGSGGVFPYGAYGYNAGDGFFGTFTGSIHFEGLGYALGNHSPTDPPIRESDVVNPSELIAIGDAELSSDSQDKVILGFASLPTPSTPLVNLEMWPTGVPLPTLTHADDAMTERHHSRWNMLFTDGHVETGATRQFFKFTDDHVVSLWNRNHQPNRLPIQ